DTAAYADYVLPATTQVEHFDLMWSWGHTNITLNQPAIAPIGEAIPNSELVRRLAARIGFDGPAFRESDEAMIRAALDSDHPYLHGITFDGLMNEGVGTLKI